MKKEKLSLKSLEVKSFVTSLESVTSKTIKGGESDNAACGPSIYCHTQADFTCQNDTLCCIGTATKGEENCRSGVSNTGGSNSGGSASVSTDPSC